MKYILFTLILIPILTIGQTRIYKASEISVDEVRFSATATIAINPNDSMIAIDLYKQTEFTLLYKITQKAPNVEVYKTFNNDKPYFIYVISTKRFGEDLSSKYEWLIQIESEDTVITYYCNESKTTY